MIQRISHFIYANRKKFLILWVILMIVSAFFFKPLLIDGSSSDSQMKNDPYFIALATMDSLFGKDADVVIKISPKNTSFSEVRKGIQSLSDSMALHFKGAETQSIIEPFAELSPNAADVSIKDVLKLSAGVPIAKNMVSKDTSSFLVLISIPNATEVDIPTLNTLVDHSYNGIETLKSFSLIQLEDEIKHLLQRDLFLLPSILLLFYILFLLYVYRSWQSIIVCIVCILPSVFFALVCFSIFNANINLVTLLAVPIIIVLSIADVIHLITGFYATTNTGKSAKERIQYSLKVYFLPSLLTSITTSLAFFSLALSQTDFIQNLGLIAGTAILGSFILTYLLIPSLLPFLPKIKIKEHKVYRLSNHFSKNRKVYSAVVVLTFVASLFFVSSIEFKSDFNTFFPKGSKLANNHDEIDKDFFSQVKLNLLISPQNPKGVSQKEFKKAVRNTVETISNFDHVKSVTYAGSKLKSLIPLPIFASTLLSKKLNLKDRFISKDGLTQRIELRFQSPNQIKRFEQQFLRDFKDGIKGYTYHFASRALVMEAIDKNTASALIKSLMASTVLIIIVILLLTKSISKTAYSLIANLAPLSAIILILGIFGLKINILTAITSVVCLGLIVDDTIHVLYRKLILKADLQELGFGMLATSILLIGGFSALNFSRFSPTQTFGNISSAVFAITLISDLTLLPLLLDYRKNKKPDDGS